MWLPKPIHVLTGMLWNMETIRDHILGHENDLLQNQWTTQNLRAFGKKDGNCGIKPTNSISCHSPFYKALNWSVFQAAIIFYLQNLQILGFIFCFVSLYIWMKLIENIQHTHFVFGVDNCVLFIIQIVFLIRFEILSRPHLRKSNSIWKSKNLSFQMANLSLKSYLTHVIPSLAIQT